MTMGDSGPPASLYKVDDEKPVTLYLVRLSPPCRIVWLYMLQHDIPHELVDVDFSNDKSAPGFIAKFPHKQVPILVDGSVVVFEGEAILRYLATKYTNNMGFGLGPESRSFCESLISWANSELHRVVGYMYVYPQFLEQYRLPTETANQALIDSGIRFLTRHLEALEKGYLAKGKYLTGERLTVADYFVATVLIQTEWVGFNFKMWPKVAAWLRLVRSQDNWALVHAAHRIFVQELERTQYDT